MRHERSRVVSRETRDVASWGLPAACRATASDAIQPYRYGPVSPGRSRWPVRLVSWAWHNVFRSFLTRTRNHKGLSAASACQIARPRRSDEIAAAQRPRSPYGTVYVLVYPATKQTMD